MSIEMPPKQAFASKAAPKTKATKATRTTKSTTQVNGNAAESNATKTAVKKPAAKTEKSKPAPANTSRKRKSEDDGEESTVMKRQRTASREPSAQPAKKAKVPVKKAAPAKAVKPKAAPRAAKAAKIYNTAPTQRLNVYVFGDGSNGELGLGNAKGQTETKRPRLNPLLGADKVGVVQLAVGGMHTAVLTHDNKILTWGVNDQGALGRDTAWEGGLRDIDDDASDASDDSDTNSGVNPHEATPGEVDMSNIPEGLIWAQVAATDSATFALTNEGQVFGWGTFRVSIVIPTGGSANMI